MYWKVLYQMNYHAHSAMNTIHRLAVAATYFGQFSLFLLSVALLCVPKSFIQSSMYRVTASYFVTLMLQCCLLTCGDVI